ncbi:hypothetical protein TanjilG_30762 [Lupinus angustifolius]|uniref:t-SNARE coiled-coil homology domain-containing protein n=1 Tax=Lupinus angustifolius TaxID=3871 RepID=A0A1J7I0V7_LUPAN|nr:hypothetical protein TanjilG_30762 [Lupinus angustifolius]
MVSNLGNNLFYIYLPRPTKENRSSKSSLIDGFDSLEEGGIRASSSYSREINEQDNDKAMESLHDRVTFLKRGNKMDGSRGLMFGTMDRFKKVFEKKSTRKTCSLVAYFIVGFIFIYYLIRIRLTNPSTNINPKMINNTGNEDELW